MTLYQVLCEHFQNALAVNLRQEEVFAQTYIAGLMLAEHQPAMAARLRALMNVEHDNECDEPECMRRSAAFFVEIFKTHGELP